MSEEAALSVSYRKQRMSGVGTYRTLTYGFLGR